MNAFAAAVVLAGVSLSFFLDEMSPTERRSHFGRFISDSRIVRIFF
jgi:hypothetical protein